MAPKVTHLQMLGLQGADLLMQICQQWRMCLAGGVLTSGKAQRVLGKIGLIWTSYQLYLSI